MEEIEKEPLWTSEQKNAIYDQSGTLLINAAAGSGKTAVLVARALQMMTREENPIDADRILILTFTNAAADELRGRIYGGLEKEARQNQKQAEDNSGKKDKTELLRRQQMLVKRAFVGTVDAFCIQTVREFFAQLNIPPDISIGDAAVLEQLLQTAMQETMEEMYEKEEFASFASLYGRARSDDGAENAVRKLYDFTLSMPNPKQQLENFAKMYDAATPANETPWGKELLQHAKKALLAAHGLASEAEDLAEIDGGLESCIPLLWRECELIENILLHVQDENWNAATTLVQNFVFERFPTPHGYQGEMKDAVQQLRNTYKKIIGDLQKYCFVCTLEENEEDRQVAKPLVKALCEAAALFGKKLFEAKLGEKVLEFSDFEHLMIKLLQEKNGERTKAAKQISARFDVVMVDEYQDTNELQSALYSFFGNEQANNLFFVGDIKQSVYRFRKANPEIFALKKKQFSPYGEGKSPAVINLGHNFRSGSGVISGVNHVFSMLMSLDLGDVDYTDDEKLIQGTEGGDENGFVLTMLVDKNKQGDAEFVAEKIETLVNEKYLVRSKDGMRPCEYGDFCILLRAKKNMPNYLAALKAKSIPVVSDSAENLLITPEVLPLIAALAAIDNPGDNVSLAAALLGPLFRFSMDEVTKIRAQVPTGGLWGALIASKNAKTINFVKTIKFYKALSTEMPAGQFCEELAEQTGYLSSLCAMENGQARRENVRAFIGWANSLAQNGRGGLSAFLRLATGGKGPLGNDFKNIKGHVSLLTIHKSKGLEFPICILADASHRFNKDDLKKAVPMHSALGVGMALRAQGNIYPTLPSRAIRSRMEREALSEEMRVLYVALTRAKDHMIVVYAHADPEKRIETKISELAAGAKNSYLHSRASNMGEWVLAAALCHKDTAAFLAQSGLNAPEEVFSQGHFKIEVCENVKKEKQKNENFVLNAKPNKQLLDELIKVFSQKRPREVFSQVPFKMSVSEIAKPESDTQQPRKRPLFMYKEGLTAAEKGTVQHNFMQFANFEAADENLQAEVLRLVEMGHLEANSAKWVNEEATKKFLNSSIMQRIKSAKKVMRECDFITSLDAKEIYTDLPKEADEKILVQGIADLVLVFDDHAEIVDYKTDKGKTLQQLASFYEKQLQLYCMAMQRQLNLPVTRLTIWAFALEAEVDVRLPVSR